MARPTPAAFDKKKIVAENRRARFDVLIDETFETGIALTRVHDWLGEEVRFPLLACSAETRAAVDAALEHAGSV